MFFSHPKVKIKLLIAQFLAIIPFLIFIFVLFDLWYDTRRELVIKENLTTATVLADNINTYLYSGINTSAILSQDKVYELMNKADILDKPQGIHLILKGIKDQLPFLSSLSFFNPSGKLIASSFDFADIPSDFDVSDRPYFRETISSGKPVISEAIIGRISGKNVVTMTSPVFENNKLVAVIASSVDLDKLKKNLETLLPEKDDKDNQIILIDQSGKVIMSLNKDFPKENENIDLSTSSSIKQALENKTVIIDSEKLPTSDKLMIGAAVPINGNTIDWTIISVTSVDNIYLPIIKAQSFIWLLLLASILFALSIISYLLRKIKIIY